MKSAGVMESPISWFLLVLGICMAAMILTVVSRQTETYADYAGEVDDMYLPHSGEDPDEEGLSPQDMDGSGEMTEEELYDGGQEMDDMGDMGEFGPEGQVEDPEMEGEPEDIAPFVGEEFTPFA